MKPKTRNLVDGSQVLRQWQLLLELRKGPRSKYELADVLGASDRTVYRDILTLEAAGFPLIATEGQRPVLWSLASMRAWPRNEPYPVRPFREPESGREDPVLRDG